jgi:hypothetical protein
MTESMHALVDDVLECVAVECPEAYRAMQQTLGDRPLELSFGSESFTITLATSGLEAGTPSGRAIEIRTTARVIRDILMGEREPLDAILADDIVVYGGADDLIAAADAGLFFVKGAARCMSLEPLVTRLKDLADREREP